MKNEAFMAKNTVAQLHAEADRLNELIDEATLTVRLDQLMEETVASVQSSQSSVPGR